MRFYYKPELIKNISDNEDWVALKKKYDYIEADAVKKWWFGFYVSIYPRPIGELTSQWILPKGHKYARPGNKQ